MKWMCDKVPTHSLEIIHVDYLYESFFKKWTHFKSFLMLRGFKLVFYIVNCLLIYPRKNDQLQYFVSIYAMLLFSEMHEYKELFCLNQTLNLL
jgi:hypothetical protein